ncbi:MAG TPA: Spy/CpxP family protein refolding chaperone [Terriglobales bacterium]|jgi:Spy/CpxP family protein refolding chaperone|nr:Spy/CpxP family protein refolding chaperone [Terriglobales bacterium]
MKSRIFIVGLAALLLCAVSYGQAPQTQPPSDQSSTPGHGDEMGDHARAHRIHHMEMMGPPMGMPMNGMPPGKWWKNAEIVQQLQLSDEQLQRLEKIFQDHRLRLIDLHASLEKEEAMLEPLTEADNPDESQVDSQIDKVAMARAELEKANTRMLLDLRKALTPDQWKKLQSMPPHFGPMPMHGQKQFELPAPPPPPGKPQS